MSSSFAYVAYAAIWQTKRVAYHESFWLAAAAAAPVIALANTVSITDSTNTLLETKVPVFARGSGYLPAIALAMLNFLVETYILIYALLSLAYGNEGAPPGLIAVLTAFGLTLVMVGVTYTVGLKFRLQSAEIRRQTQEILTAEKPRPRSSGVGWPEVPNGHPRSARYSDAEPGR